MLLFGLVVVRFRISVVVDLYFGNPQDAAANTARRAFRMLRNVRRSHLEIFGS